MIFRSSKHFRRHELNNGTLWLAGYIDRPLGELNYRFADHDVLDLKGQFGLVWQGHDGWWLAQCDHLCTYPLWYRHTTEEVFSHWCNVKGNDNDWDEIFFAQRDILHGQMTVGTRTPIKDIERVQPDHCLDAGTQMRYRWSLDVQWDGPTDWHDRLLEAIKRNCEHGDVLMLSGGRDSTTIACVAKHLGIELDYVHITRGKTNPDTESCKEFAQELGIDVRYLDPWEEELDWEEHYYWHDSSYAPKRQCLQMLGKTRGVSGELGASESGSKKINTILQRPDITIEQLTNIWITTLERRDEATASPLVHDDYTEWAEHNYFYATAYKEIIEHHEQMYEHYKSLTDETDQLLKAVVMLHQQDHEAYRLHNYSQDKELTWKHPFSHPAWFDVVWNAPLEKRKLNHHNREIYRIATEGCDWFKDTAWKYGGPRGLTQ